MRLSKSVLIAFASVLLFSSCGSFKNFHIEKRRYMHGFYIEKGLSPLASVKSNGEEQQTVLCKQQDVKHRTTEKTFTAKVSALVNLPAVISTHNHSLVVKPIVYSPAPASIVLLSDTAKNNREADDDKDPITSAMPITGALLVDLGCTALLIPAFGIWALFALIPIIAGIILIAAGLGIRTHAHDPTLGIVTLFMMIFAPIYLLVKGIIWLLRALKIVKKKPQNQEESIGWLLLEAFILLLACLLVCYLILFYQVRLDYGLYILIFTGFVFVVFICVLIAAIKSLFSPKDAPM